MCESRTFTYKEAILALAKINDVRERSAINHLKKLQENGLLTQEMDTGKYHRSGTKD
jgi:DNA-binding IclR family transcriptional regulator